MACEGLTEVEKEEFFSRGYFIRRQAFSFDEVRVIASLFDQVQKTAKGLTLPTLKNNSQFVVHGQRIDRVVWVCGTEPDLRLWAHDPRILKPCSELLGSKELNQIICQSHFKLPGDGVEFEWHQDSQHRMYGTPMWNDINGRGSFVQTLVAVDPCPLESGPLYFVPGGLEKGHLGLEDIREADKRWIEERAVPVTMDPGDLVFFHPFSVHGSKANLSKNPRRVFINGFAFPGANARIYPGCGLGERVHVDNIESKQSA